MPADITFFWKRTCSTCRNARDVLSQTDIDYREREYFKQPFTEDELRGLLAGRPATDIFSWRSPTARSMGLSAKNNALSDDELIRLMVEQPNLIRRPLFTVNGEIVTGFDKPAQARLTELIGQPLGQ